MYNWLKHEFLNNCTVLKLLWFVSPFCRLVVWVQNLEYEYKVPSMSTNTKRRVRVPDFQILWVRVRVQSHEYEYNSMSTSTRPWDHDFNPMRKGMSIGKGEYCSRAVYQICCRCQWTLQTITTKGQTVSLFAWQEHAICIAFVDVVVKNITILSKIFWYMG